jgi:serine/threonine protein kinase
MTPDPVPPAPLPGAAAGPPPGSRIAGRYEIVRPLGRGGFAHTFLARDLAGNREVALKMLASRSVTEFKTAELFEREAQVLLGLRHRGVPEFIDFFRAEMDGGPSAVLVMEFIDGASLARMIAERRVLAPERVLVLLLDLLEILDYLHTRVPPVLHRDIKPANVVVRLGGEPVLVDFGAVRRAFLAPGEAGPRWSARTATCRTSNTWTGEPGQRPLRAGATFLHLVTGRPPSEFMNDEGRIEVPASLPAGEPVRDVVARLGSPRCGAIRRRGRRATPCARQRRARRRGRHGHLGGACRGAAQHHMGPRRAT